MTLETIEALGKIILGLAAVLVPLVKLYLEMLKARFEADTSWEKVRYYETGIPGQKRQKCYSPWRRKHASTPVCPKADLGEIRSEDHSADSAPGAEGGGEGQR